MKIIALNGSPRKNKNTGTLLKKALEGAASVGAETQLVHLYDVDYKGCTSCFACKMIGGKSLGRCAMRDGLSPVLEAVEAADAIIMGSPIYFGSVTGEVRSFMERLAFQYLQYTNPPQVLCPRKIDIGLIYTMNVDEHQMASAYAQDLLKIENFMKRALGGRSETLYCFDTYQFDDYSKVRVDYFDPEKKAKRHKEVFPVDCEKAFELGIKMTEVRAGQEAGVP